MERLISVIVPIYNASEYLTDCLNSLAVQTDYNYEVILVDDGSTDQSYSICEDFCNHHDKFRVIHKENGGVSSARNHGILESKGELLCFVDSDDYVKPDYIKDLRCEMTLGVDFVLSKFYFVNGDDIITPFAEYRKGMPEVLFSKENIIACQAPYGKLFKSNIIVDNSIWFDENVRYGEDRLFVYTYIYYTHLVVVSSKLNYFYIRRPDSLTSKIYSLSQEEYAYKECKSVVNRLVEKLNLTEKDELDNLYAEICDFGNRILNAIYHTSGLSRKERCAMMNMIDMDFHSKYLRADSVKEKIIRLLLRMRLYAVYDIIRYIKLSNVRECL